MTVRPSRFLAALLGPAIAAAVGLTGCAGTAPESASSSSSGAPSGTTQAGTSATEQRIEVQVAGGEVSGDTGRVQVAAGAHVTLVITSDVADEVHVHGYDLESELSPGQPTELTFDATIPGVFEVELHGAGTLLLSLQVA